MAITKYEYQFHHHHRVTLARHESTTYSTTTRNGRAEIQVYTDVKMISFISTPFELGHTISVYLNALLKSSSALSLLLMSGLKIDRDSVQLLGTGEKGPCDANNVRRLHCRDAGQCKRR